MLVSRTGGIIVGQMVRILGIDPGSSVTGYGIVEECADRLVHVENGEISVSSKSLFPRSLKRIYDTLQDVILEFTPHVVAVEDLFFYKNVKTALKLGHARGIAILAGVNAGLDVHEYSPLEIKQAVVGYGRATKGQIQEMVKELLNLPDIISFDASDALAVAICHIHSIKMKDILKQPR